MTQNPMKNQVSQPPNPQSGSMIVWILIMIALFGALSFALSQGTRQGTSQLTKEQAKLAATDVLDFSQKVKDGVKLLTIGHSCKDTELSFQNSVLVINDGTPASPAAHYPSAPPDKHCHVFDIKGAGIQPIEIKRAQVPQPHVGGARTGNAIFQRVIVPGVGTSAADLVMVIPQLKKEVCEAINDLANGSSNIPFSAWATTYYDNTYTSADTYDTNLSTKQQGCFTNDAWAINTHFYKVLIAR